MSGIPQCAWLAALAALAGSPGIHVAHHPEAVRVALTCRELADLFAEYSGLSGNEPSRLLIITPSAKGAARPEGASLP